MEPDDFYFEFDSKKSNSEVEVITYVEGRKVSVGFVSATEVAHLIKSKLERQYNHLSDELTVASRTLQIIKDKLE